MTDGKIQVRSIEIDPDTVQIIWNEEPRISAGGAPIARSHIVTFSRDDEPTAGLVADLVDNLTDYVEDILAALGDEHTQSLEEFEASIEDDELDLGMGDERPGGDA